MPSGRGRERGRSSGRVDLRHGRARRRRHPAGIRSRGLPGRRHPSRSRLHAGHGHMRRRVSSLGRARPPRLDRGAVHHVPHLSTAQCRRERRALARGRGDAGRFGQCLDHGRRRWPTTVPSRRRSPSAQKPSNRFCAEGPGRASVRSTSWRRSPARRCWTSPTSRSTSPRSTEAGIAGEIQAQLLRGDTLLRLAGLHPAGGPWMDAASDFSQGDAADLASGVQVAGASQLVLNDADLEQSGRSNFTFAQPFDLDMGHGPDIAAVAADGSLGARFTATPADPVLGAQQLVAGLSFVHFENPFLPDRRGVVVTPPPGWRASGTLRRDPPDRVDGQPCAPPVTVQQLFAQVPVAGNDEPSTRRLQSGPTGQRDLAPDRTADRRRPGAALVLQRRRDGTPLEPEHALRRPAGGRSPIPEPGPACPGAQRVRARLRRTDRPDHAGHGAHRDLHLADRADPDHGAVGRPVSGARGHLAGERQVRLPERELSVPDARPADHLGADARPGAGRRATGCPSTSPCGRPTAS